MHPGISLLHFGISPSKRTDGGFQMIWIPDTEPFGTQWQGITAVQRSPVDCLFILARKDL